MEELVGDGLHDERLAAAREAAEQVAAWQAVLVERTEALMQTPCADHWGPYLAWTLGLTRAEAGELVELVDRLSELPRTREVLASGERSLRTVLSIARHCTPELEDVVLDSTDSFTGNQLARSLREFARVVAPSDRVDDEPEDVPDHTDPPASSASWSWHDGRLRLRADLDPADAAIVHPVLEAERRRLAEQHLEGEITYVAPYQRTCAEALVALAERAAASRADSVGFAPESVTTSLVIHAHEADDGTVTLDRAFIPGAGPVSTWTLDMLAERGPLVSTVMVHGEPIMATSPTRLATRDQKRALLARDGGCAYPGCDTTRNLIAHHIRYYDHDGPTQLRNLVLLCRRHHRIVHRHALRIVPDPDAPADRFLWRFLDRDSQPITPAHPGAPPRLATRPGTRPRRTGTGEPLTLWGLSTIVEHWLNAA